MDFIRTDDGWNISTAHICAFEYDNQRRLKIYLEANELPHEYYVANAAQVQQFMEAIEGKGEFVSLAMQGAAGSLFLRASAVEGFKLSHDHHVSVRVKGRDVLFEGIYTGRGSAKELEQEVIDARNVGRTHVAKLQETALAKATADVPGDGRFSGRR